MLDGFKTYVMSGVLACMGGVDWIGWFDALPDDAAPMTIAFAAAIAALRHGIAKAKA